MNRFRDREEAGRKLAAALGAYAGARPVVLALPRGGVPVGYEIARTLKAPLDVWVVRKVGVPWQPELGVGAVAEGDYVYLSDEMIRQLGLSRDEIGAVVRARRREVAERVRRFRGEHPPVPLRGRTVIIVDDGIATGGTVRAAIRSIRARAPAEIVLAVPVAAPETVRALESEVERVVCLQTPTDLRAVGLWYVDFGQVSDDEVERLLDRARRPEAHAEQVPQHEPAK